MENMNELVESFWAILMQCSTAPKHGTTSQWLPTISMFSFLQRKMEIQYKKSGIIEKKKAFSIINSFSTHSTDSPMLWVLANRCLVLKKNNWRDTRWGCITLLKRNGNVSLTFVPDRSWTRAADEATAKCIRWQVNYRRIYYFVRILAMYTFIMYNMVLLNPCQFTPNRSVIIFIGVEWDNVVRIWKITTTKNG